MVNLRICITGLYVIKIYITRWNDKQKGVKGMIFTGKLVYNDDGNYELHNDEGIFYLTDALNEIYYSRNNHLSLRIANGNKLLFNEDSTIYKKINKYGIYSFYICGADLETVLFNNTDEIVDVVIMAEAMDDYEQFYEAKEA